MADFVGHQFVVQLDTQPWLGWNANVAVFHFEWFFDVSVAEADLLLAKKIGNAGR